MVVTPALDRVEHRVSWGRHHLFGSAASQYGLVKMSARIALVRGRPDQLTEGSFCGKTIAHVNPTPIFKTITNVVSTRRTSRGSMMIACRGICGDRTMLTNVFVQNHMFAHFYREVGNRSGLHPVLSGGSLVIAGNR